MSVHEYRPAREKLPWLKQRRRFSASANRFRFRAGDGAARDELIERACGRLRRLTRKLLADFPRVRNYADSGDVLQNAVLRMLRRLEACPPGTVQAFFQMAAREIRCELLDLVRHYYGPHGPGQNEVAAVPEDSSQATLEPSDHHHEPRQLAQWTEFHEQVKALPAGERAVFDLLWYHGMTQDEAAEILNWSLATVKRRWLEQLGCGFRAAVAGRRNGA